MSHMVTVANVSFSSEDMLRRAVHELKVQKINCELVRDSTCRFFYKSDTKYPLVLKLVDCQYDVAFELKEGKLVPVFDSYGGYIQKIIGCSGNAQGSRIKKLVDAYALEVASDQARSVCGTMTHRYEKNKLVIEICR